jgi:hypothetical protein
MNIDPCSLRENPYQTRSDVSVVGIGDLVQSIRRNGQDEAVEVYVDDDGQYTILEGHRRVLACAALGRKVRCRVVKKPDEVDLLQTIWRRNTCRRNHTPSAVMISYVFNRVKQCDRDGERRRTLREMSHELGVGYEKLRSCFALYKKLDKLSPQLSKQALKEKWSENEIRVCLGLPHQKAHKAKVPWNGPVRPMRVFIQRDKEGQLWMQCRMQPDTDPELLRDYYASKRWPEPQILIPGFTRMKKVRDVHENRMRAREGEVPVIPVVAQRFVD